MVNPAIDGIDLRFDFIFILRCEFLTHDGLYETDRSSPYICIKNINPQISLTNLSKTKCQTECQPGRGNGHRSNESQPQKDNRPLARSHQIRREHESLIDADGHKAEGQPAINPGSPVTAQDKGRQAYGQNRDEHLDEYHKRSKKHLNLGVLGASGASDSSKFAACCLLDMTQRTQWTRKKRSAVRQFGSSVVRGVESSVCCQLLAAGCQLVVRPAASCKLPAAICSLTQRTQ